MLVLIDATFSMLDAARRGDGAFRAAIGADVAPGWLEFPEALAAMCADYEKSPAAREWGTLFFVLEEPRRLVGWGGYKGAPKDGAVEIGYAIAPGERGKGLATEAARAMVERAFASPAVKTALAHTLAQENASTAVLKKLGFCKTAEFTDPEDGPVWAWRLERAIQN